jgi:hypothetical protein
VIPRMNRVAHSPFPASRQGSLDCCARGCGRFGRVGVAAVFPLQEVQSHERVKEISITPIVKPQPPGEFFAFERTRSQFTEQSQFDSAQQRLRCPGRTVPVSERRRYSRKINLATM